MNQSSKHQKEYIRRINNVIDYIDSNLDEFLCLNKIAEVANFSPYHFHRIFTTFTGETLNNFVKRLRVEKAARLLIIDIEKPISEIAYYCGYNNTSVFCRAFKGHFKMNAMDYRNKYSKNGKYKSKNGKLNVPAGKFAVGHFEIDVTEFEQAWNAMCLWVSESGYQPSDDNPYELYHQNPEHHPEKKFVLDICIPVKPL